MSDPIKEDFREVAKDSQCKEREETSKATDIFIYLFIYLFIYFCFICPWRSLSRDSNQKLLENSYSDHTFTTPLSSVVK